MKHLLLCFFLMPVALCAQDYVQPKSDPVVPGAGWNFGIGAGLDYGGFGGQLQYRPVAPVALFAGGGYALAGMGYNLGAMLRLTPKERWCPFLSGMYGYNAVIVVKDASEYNELYYGTSFGLGLEVHARKNPARFFTVQLLLPLRPQAFEDDMEALRKNPTIQVKGEPPAVAFSFGYHFGG